MQLKSLTIQIIQWGDNVGNYKGEAEFIGSYGETKLFLDHEKCKGMLKVVADALVESSKEIANHMTANVIDSSQKLISS